MDQTRSGLSIRKSQAFLQTQVCRHGGDFGVRIECLASDLNGVEDPPQSRSRCPPCCVCTENFIQVDDVMESPKLAE
jgi:hypothetical protein